MSDPAGQRFADFEIISKLGEGGMGSVWKARQPMLNRFVALKVISSSVAREPEFVARFRREAMSAAQLNHANIVQFYTCGESDGVPYMACEFVEGESLQNKLDRRGRFDPRQALAICVYVCEALRHAWDCARIIHRDIKPDNIFLSANGEVKVGDFGLAKSMGGPTAGITKKGSTMGTPHYMSPEQARGLKDMDFRSDIYSVGCMLFHLLTGRVVYESKSAIEVMTQQAFGPPPAILQIMPDCPAQLAILLGKMLTKDRNQRHGSYEALIADMLRVREQIQAPMNSIARAPAVGAAPLTPRVVKSPTRP